MPTFELKESDYKGPIPEDTVLAAEVVEIKQEKQRYKDKDTNEDVFKLRFKFCVVQEDSEWNGDFVYGRTSLTFTTNPKCKLYAWACEILATDLPSGYKLDTDALIGMRCRVVMAVDEYDDKDNPGEKKQSGYVKEVLRSREAMTYAEEPF